MSSFFSDFVNDLTLPFTNPVLVFGIVLLIIFAAPLLLRRLNVPSVIGLILAGVLIGPHGLNWIDNANAGIELFSTIGLLYIMFIVGLELDLNEFSRNRNKSLGFGFFTFAIPLIIGFPVLYYILGYDFNTSFLTASMFSTHTLVTYPIVSRLGVARNEAVAITAGGTIFTDTAVLIILAIILSNNDGGIEFSFLLKLLLSLVLFSLIVFFVIPIVARWFFRRTEAEKYSNYVLVLLLVFFAAFLAEMGGIEPIIGAFAAGLALNRLIPHSSALMNRIEFIGNALFIPVFLVSVGMMVNLSVVLDGMTTIMIAVVLTVVAMAGKWLAAFATQKTYKYSIVQRNLIFGLSSSHAAATLAVIIVGYKAGIIDEHILNGTIILILITCVWASFITQGAAKQIVIEEENEPLSPSALGEFAQEKILVPIANPSNIGHHVELALLLKDKRSVNPVSLLGVVENDEEAEKNIVSFRKNLKEFVDTATAAEVNVEIITTIDQSPANGIVRTARETMSDVVILGWPGKVGVLEKLLGDKVDLIIKNVDKNLFMCHVGHNLIDHQRIVVISPPLVEKEDGFALWVDKVSKLSAELTLPVLHLGHPDTQKIIAREKKSGNFTFEPFTDWGHPFSFSNIIKKNDMIILISAHQGYVSHIPVLDKLPTRLEKKYPDNSKIVIFPKRSETEQALASEELFGSN